MVRPDAQPYSPTDNPQGDATALAAMIDTARVRAVALNSTLQFLPRVSSGERMWIETRYPNVERAGSVDVFWR